MNIEFVIYVLTGLFCVLTLLASAGIILLVKCYNRFADVYGVLMDNNKMISQLHKKINYITEVLDDEVIKYSDIRKLKEELDGEPYPEPGEVEELDEEDLDIHLISREEYLFGKKDEFSKNFMWYDTVKNVIRASGGGLLHSEDFNPETAEFLGDGLRFFGVCSQNDPNVVYIRNHRMKADFLVEKSRVVDV